MGLVVGDRQCQNQGAVIGHVAVDMKQHIWSCCDPLRPAQQRMKCIVFLNLIITTNCPFFCGFDLSAGNNNTVFCLFFLGLSAVKRKQHINTPVRISKVTLSSQRSHYSQANGFVEGTKSL